MERGDLSPKTHGECQRGRRTPDKGMTFENCVLVARVYSFPCADSSALALQAWREQKYSQDPKREVDYCSS